MTGIDLFASPGPAESLRRLLLVLLCDEEMDMVEDEAECVDGKLGAVDTLLSRIEVTSSWRPMCLLTASKMICSR